MFEPTDPPPPVWYDRLRGEIARCPHVRELRPILKALSALQLAARLDGDERAEDMAVSLQRDAIQHGADLHDRAALRDLFAWRPLPIANNHDGPPVCCVMRVGAGEVEVARLSRKGGHGEWQATLDQHRPWEKRRVRDCTGYDAGRAGVEAWAARHFARLHTEAQAMRAGHPSGSWDECRATDCTRGCRLLCDACDVPLGWTEPVPDDGEAQPSDGTRARA